MAHLEEVAANLLRSVCTTNSLAPSRRKCDPPDNVYTVKSWFDKLSWPQATPIKDRNLRDAKDGWKPDIPSPHPDASLVESLKSGAFAGRNVHIAIDTEELTPAQEREGDRCAKILKQDDLTYANKKFTFWLESIVSDRFDGYQLEC